MADRRTDDTPLAPRRTLAGSSGANAGQQSAGESETRRPSGGKLAERLQGAVASAGESVRNVTEQLKNERTAGQTARTSPATPTRPPTSAARPRTRKARLRLTHIDPWSVMKTAFLLSVAFGVVTVIAVAVVWSVLGAAGVWDSINQTVKDVLGSGSGSSTGTTFDVTDYIGTGRVLGFTMIVAVVDVVLVTAIATLSAFIYNLAAALLGGLEVTLAEDER